jgi:hypothetical protein
VWDIVQAAQTACDLSRGYELIWRAVTEEAPLLVEQLSPLIPPLPPHIEP